MLCTPTARLLMLHTALRLLPKPASATAAHPVSALPFSLKRSSWPAVDISSGDGTAPSRVAVLHDRRDKIRRRAELGIETRAIGALVHAPAVVPAYTYDVDLFQRALPDVTDIQLARLAIK